MAAYALNERASVARNSQPASKVRHMAAPPARADLMQRASGASGTDLIGHAGVIDELLERIADRVAAAIADRLTTHNDGDGEWFDSRHAAEYLGVHRDTLRKLAAERAIPSEQDRPGCKLYFRRSDLDDCRRLGGRPRHLSSVPASAA